MSTRFKPYPSYKDSGVPWLGRIPAHWRALKIKRLSLVKRGASPRPIDDPIYFSENGEYAWVRISDVTASTKYLLQTYERLSQLGRTKSVALEPGEIFLSIAATVGKPIITKIKCCIHDGFVYFVGLKENREFLYWLFSSGGLYQGLGKLGTQLNLNTDTIGDIRIPIPSSDEQTAIADFLDREAGKIDSLVKKKERLIELLQVKRTALISHTITKGLNPNAPMKDSGVPWLGKIPAHWEIKRLKFIAEVRSGAAKGRDFGDRDTMEVPYLRVANVQDGYLDLSDIASILIAKSELNHYSLRPGDVLMNEGGDYDKLGRGSVWEGQVVPCVHQNHVFAVRPHQLHDSEWINTITLTAYAKFYFMMRSKQSTNLASISATNIQELPVVMPPNHERKSIKAFLDRETAKCDALTTKVRQAIERLQEYRTALISAAVTGQINVMQSAP